MGKNNSYKQRKEKIRSYKEIALFYDYLMRSIDYKKWAGYIFDIYKDLNIKGDSVLEIASGTCALSKYLNNKFPKMLATDKSPDMLETVELFESRKVVCDMTALPFKTKFDFIFSTFDSINYLTDEKNLKRMFTEIYSVLDINGVFTFDASLKLNSIKYEKSMNRKGKYKGIKYTQTSNFNRVEKIHTNIFQIELPDGTIVEETHKQKVYEIEDYFRFADDADLMVMDCYEAFTLNDISQKSERAQFIIKRKV